MKSQYFCAYHAENMKVCESEALRCWLQMMQRGEKAYVECRMEAARIYMGCALDIAILRSHCKRNSAFSGQHILKPAELLVQLQLACDNLETATELLTRTIETVSAEMGNRSDFKELTTALFEQIEAAEKVSLGFNPKTKNSISSKLLAVH